ncbi:MAG: hypothetical protein C0505_02675 [Leptothrix sp. (in: Bacteria)]|nr:hypothetical protein [Leptothrix sp. (in: b-proteobacteria)]
MGAALRAAGLDVAMVYIPQRRDNDTPDKFRHYGVPVEMKLSDAEDVVVIVGETATDWVWRVNRAQVLIWWLSVDFHFKRPEKWTKRAKLWLRERLPRNRPYAFQPHPRVRHAWQSEYARQFLLRQGVTDPLPLTDYIAPALTVPENELPAVPRRNVCLYNPRKGWAFTQQLIAACEGSGIEFVPLQGYSEAQLRELFGSSKLYIDFGEHPGRDRIPREAAASGCIVITGRRGSAANAVDVPLPEACKVDETAPGVLGLLRERLTAICADDAAHRAAQADYRAWIRPQRETFFAEAAALGSALSRSR